MFSEYIDKIPAVEYLPQFDNINFPGIHAILFEGAPCGGKQTKFFAYIGFPEGASEQSKVPSMVLQHGGGGFAFPEWVRQWNMRGYAAIAISNTGYIPKYNGNPEFYALDSWTRETGEDWILTPDNDTTEMADGDLDTQWLYHAVISGMLARNIMLADPRSDGKIGLTGISWGGVITSLTMGFQPEFDFFIPIYGCAYLGESKTWMNRYFTPKTLTLWDATKRLDNVKAPILWLNWAEDTAFDIHTNSKSYLHTQDHAVMSMRYQMGHSHDLGWLPPESYRFADGVLGRGKGMTRIIDYKQNKDGVEVTLSIPDDAQCVSAQLHYITAPLTYKNGEGNSTEMVTLFNHDDATVSGNKVAAVIPEQAVEYYVEIYTDFGQGNCSTSTPLIQK